MDSEVKVFIDEITHNKTKNSHKQTQAEHRVVCSNSNYNLNDN